MPRLATLGDGTIVVLRPIRADDEDRLAAFHRHLTADSVRFRFFTAHPVLTPKELHRFTHVDGDRRLAHVAVHADEIVGVGRYESLDGSDDVEGAWVVRDDFQHRGLGHLLVRLIVEEARRHGKRHLVAVTLPENARMRAVLLDLGLPTTTAYQDGTVELRLALADRPSRTTRAG